MASKLRLIDERRLAVWFLENYIVLCAQLCSKDVSRLFDDVSTTTTLQNAVSAVVVWRKYISRDDSWSGVYIAERNIPVIVSVVSLTARSCLCWMNELRKIDTRLPVFFTAIAFLHVAYKISRRGFTNELMGVLATTGQQIDTRRFSSQCGSVLSLGEAAKLMKVVANKSLSTMSLIETELTKAYLYRALRCKDSGSDSIYCLTNVYLAVLYYTLKPSLSRTELNKDVFSQHYCLAFSLL